MRSLSAKIRGFGSVGRAHGSAFMWCVFPIKFFQIVLIYQVILITVYIYRVFSLTGNLDVYDKALLMEMKRGIEGRSKKMAAAKAKSLTLPAIKKTN